MRLGTRCTYWEQMCSNLASSYHTVHMGAHSSSTKNWEWAGTPRRFDYPHATAHPRCKISCQGVPIDLYCHFAHASLRPVQWWRKLYRARKWTNLQPRCQPSEAFVTCSTQISYCRQRMLQTKLQMGMYETLRPDVVAPEAHQNDGSYVHELSGLTYDLLHKNLA